MAFVILLSKKQPISFFWLQNRGKMYCAYSYNHFKTGPNGNVLHNSENFSFTGR